jgi:ABC-type polysaccharide/polyol phosphate export permease
MIPRPADLDHAPLVDRSADRQSLAGTFRGLARYRHLLVNLVYKDLKLKYRGSVFGFLWSLANPLLMIGVYTVAFTYILRIRSEGFVFYLMLGILTWTFFANSLSMSTGSLADNGGLVKSVFFPRAVLPAATVLFNLAQYILTVLVFLPVMLAWYGVWPAAPMLLFPIFLALQVIFTIGLAMILATGTAFFRDVRHLVEVGLAVLFWTTPIVYQLQEVPDRLRWIILLSPASPFVHAYQQMFYYRTWPDSATWLVAGAYAAGAFAIGLWLLVRSEDRLAESI